MLFARPNIFAEIWLPNRYVDEHEGSEVTDLTAAYGWRFFINVIKNRLPGMPVDSTMLRKEEEEKRKKKEFGKRK